MNASPHSLSGLSSALLGPILTLPIVLTTALTTVLTAVLTAVLTTGLTVLLTMAVTTVATVQAQSKCPHQGIKSIESKLRLGPIQKCGTSVTLKMSGVTINHPVKGCPLWAIYEPPHDKPTPKENHYVKPDRALPIVLFKMVCEDSWLLGFIPIPIGSYCELKGTSNIGAIQNYIEFTCESVVKQGSSTTQAN